MLTKEQLQKLREQYALESKEAADVNLLLDEVGRLRAKLELRFQLKKWSSKLDEYGYGQVIPKGEPAATLEKMDPDKP